MHVLLVLPRHVARHDLPSWPRAARRPSSGRLCRRPLQTRCCVVRVSRAACAPEGPCCQPTARGALWSAAVRRRVLARSCGSSLCSKRKWTPVVVTAVVAGRSSRRGHWLIRKTVGDSRRRCSSVRAGARCRGPRGEAAGGTSLRAGWRHPAAGGTSGRSTRSWRMPLCVFATYPPQPGRLVPPLSTRRGGEPCAPARRPFMAGQPGAKVAPRGRAGPGRARNLYPIT